MKFKSFDESQRFGLVVAGNLVQRLQLAHRTFRKLNLIVMFSEPALPSVQWRTRHDVLALLPDEAHKLPPPPISAL